MSGIRRKYILINWYFYTSKYLYRFPSSLVVQMQILAASLWWLKSNFIHYQSFGLGNEHIVQLLKCGRTAYMLICLYNSLYAYRLSTDSNHLFLPTVKWRKNTSLWRYCGDKINHEIDQHHSCHREVAKHPM